MLSEKFTTATRTANNVFRDPGAALEVARLIVHARDFRRGREAEYLADIALTMLAYNMRNQIKAEGQPAEELAKEWGDALLATVRRIAKLLET